MSHIFERRDLVSLLEDRPRPGPEINNLNQLSLFIIIWDSCDIKYFYTLRMWRILFKVFKIINRGQDV